MLQHRRQQARQHEQRTQARLHRRLGAPVGETGNLAQAWVRRPLAQHVLRHQLMMRGHRVGEDHGVDERHPIDDLAEEIGRRSHRDRPGGRLGDEQARSAASNTTASECRHRAPCGREMCTRSVDGTGRPCSAAAVTEAA
ncbi:MULTISPECIES: hypothetical protein [Dermacoccus]|uniref:hypothetical protein n=1 Tax=Dermacoccus TaxID=57495 RepID=UPI00123798FA|nr:hypothetical protein [Dermacoccus nishinomiyaensis]